MHLYLYRTDKNAERGSGHNALFLGFSKHYPRGTYLIEVKGKRKGTIVDSRHVDFDVDSLLNAASTSLRSGQTKAPSISDEQSAKKPSSEANKFLAQELVDEDRVLVPGPKFIPKNGNWAKYITDRLQILLGLRPWDTTRCKFQKKWAIADYTVGDCAYDLNMGYLSLVDRSSDIGSASINICNVLTSKRGSLTDTVSARPTGTWSRSL